ncbi:hypothetical protein TRIP_B170034 [uncultured Desulfatiglans sp.]|nr:hypothetical protein TRIP_B170034 [uncultured Desulfatiglans sp.]
MYILFIFTTILSPVDLRLTLVDFESVYNYPWMMGKYRNKTAAQIRVERPCSSLAAA